MKILRTADPVEGGDTAPANAAPPVTAKIVATGKTERELLLERQNQKLVATVKKTVLTRRQVEEKAAHVLRENELLKQQAQQTAAKQKSQWLGFTS